MDKFFENMDQRFNSIEEELDYSYTPDNWQAAEQMLDDAILDNSFVEAVQNNSPSSDLNFESVDDAFLDDAFIEASTSNKASYTSAFFNDFKTVEESLYQDDTFVEAAQTTNANYNSEYWNAANIALENEGLHHEYKSTYWAEAEKLLIKDKRKGFFFLWGSIATVLLLFTAVGINFNSTSTSTISKVNTNELTPIKNFTSVTPILKENKETYTKQENQISNSSKSSFSQLDKTNTTNTEDSFLQTNSNKNNLDEINTSNESTSSTFTPTDNKTKLKKALDNEKTDLTNTSVTEQSLIERNESETEVTTNTTPRKRTHIALLKAIQPPLLETEEVRQTTENFTKLTPTVITPIHEIGIKLEKGLGNVFTDNTTSFSSRHALYIDYRFKPIKKLNRFEFGFEAGLYHMNLDNLQYEQNYSIHQNHGGVDHMWAKMTYKDLIFISSNVNAYYKLNATHKLKIAFGIDKLVTSKIDMKYKSNLETTVHSNAGEWGVNNGINTVDFTFGVGYEYMINSNFSFLIDSKFGTMDKTNNNYLRNTKMNRDFSILLGLKYKIFASH